MKRLILFVVLGLVLAACGGDSGDSAPETTLSGEEPAATTTTEPQSGDDGEETPTETTASSDEEPDAGNSGDDEGSGPSTATVTIGDQTYEFTTEGALVAQCLTDIFGVFSVQLPLPDGSGGVSIVALREGTDPDVIGEVNSVEVNLEDEDWIADEADMVFEMYDVMEPGMSQVDSLEIDGRTVRGTATFVREFSLFSGDEPEIATGTFEATCGEERTS